MLLADGELTGSSGIRVGGPPRSLSLTLFRGHGPVRADPGIDKFQAAMHLVPQGGEPGAEREGGRDADRHQAPMALGRRPAAREDYRALPLDLPRFRRHPSNPDNGREGRPFHQRRDISPTRVRKIWKSFCGATDGRRPLSTA